MISTNFSIFIRLIPINFYISKILQNILFAHSKRLHTLKIFLQNVPNIQCDVIFRPGMLGEYSKIFKIIIRTFFAVKIFFRNILYVIECIFSKIQRFFFQNSTKIQRPLFSCVNKIITRTLNTPDDEIGAAKKRALLASDKDRRALNWKSMEKCDTHSHHSRLVQVLVCFSRLRSPRKWQV